MENNISKAQRTMYGLMAAGLHGENCLDPETALQLLRVYVMPILTYGLEICLATGTDLKSLDAFLCPRHKMERWHLVFALSVLPSFFHSVLPSFCHIKVCLLNSSYIHAWISMKLGRDVVPQVWKCMWGDNSCSTNFSRVMALDT